MTQKTMSIPQIMEKMIILSAEKTMILPCPLCREKYGCTNGKYREKEGVPIVKEFLSNTGMSGAQIGRVAFLIGHHHTYRAIEKIAH